MHYRLGKGGGGGGRLCFKASLESLVQYNALRTGGGGEGEGGFVLRQAWSHWSSIMHCGLGRGRLCFKANCGLTGPL